MEKHRALVPCRVPVLCRAFLGVAFALAVPAASRATEAKVLFGTGLSIDGITFSPRAFSSNWGGYSAMGTAEAASGSVGVPPAFIRHFTLHTGPAATAPVFSGIGTFAVGGGSGAEPPSFVSAEWRVSADKAGRFAEAFVGTDIPTSRIGGGTAIIDGVEIAIPAERGPKGHLFRNPASSIELRGPDGATILRVVLDEPTPTLLQDNRHWNGDGLGIRLYFATGSCEAEKEYAVKAKFFSGGSGAEPPSLVAADPVRIVAGPDWLPLAQEPWIEPGSALDFSTVLPRHEPAGKFGRVIAVGDHFEFEGLPGVPQRFYGVNICDTANLPDSADDAERIAANLARMGYNAVRIHHHERWLVRENGKLPEAAGGGSGAEPPSLEGGTALDPALVDKFDLLVAACVKHGLYLTTDLFVSRSNVIPWRALGIDRDGSVPTEKFKILCAFHEPAYSNLCAWARNFLTHVNPHTGRSLAEEPALATLALINEGNLGNWGATALRDLPCVATSWNAWQDAKRNEKWKMENGNNGGEQNATSTFSILHSPFNQSPIPDSLYTQPFATFLADAETRLYERLRDFVRNELHCPVPLSSLSAWYEPVQYALPRAGFDYIDTHFYVDHPQFLDKSWRLPSRCPNQNPMRGSNRGAQDCVWIRQFGKPFTVSEFNFSGPGRYRGVGGIATGALAALQDWGGIWRFDWACSRAGITKPSGPMGYFDIANDPLSLAAERAALCLFLRGDLAPLEAEEPLVLDPIALRDPANGAPRIDSLGENATAWSSLVGTRLVGAGKEPASPNSSLVTRHSSLRDSGTVSIDPATGTFLIDTPRTCGGFAESGAHIAGPLRFEILASTNHSSLVTRHSSLRGGEVAATVWVSSLDGAPIASSSHLLLTHLTDVQNNGIEYADPDLTILLKWGWLPHLMRRGAAHIELSLEVRGSADANEGAQQSSAIKGALRANEERGSAANDDELSLPPQAATPFAAQRGPSLSAQPTPSLPLEERPVIGGKPAWRVFRLSPSGRRIGEVPFTFDGAHLRFFARIDYDPTTATYLYEIVRQ